MRARCSNNGTAWRIGGFKLGATSEQRQGEEMSGMSGCGDDMGGSCGFCSENGMVMGMVVPAVRRRGSCG